ncbi:MAG: hypothetical protein IT350_12540 [Deltaproteobacteria bacterium]|nr:hypothetical protein [Deltaproteobacteria bacterium]
MEVLRAIDSDVIEVVPIVDWDGNSSPVEFEWIGWRKPLEGGQFIRGKYKTSADAVIVARTPSGQRAYVFEWKYSEKYKGEPLHGNDDTRRGWYAARFAAPTSAFIGAAPLDDFLFEPCYQIMRLLLLADRMMEEGVTRDLRVDEARVVVACPAANDDYRRIVKKTQLARRFPHLDMVEEVVRATLKEPGRFSIVAQENLVATLRASTLAPSLAFWLDYHRERYGW